MKPNAPFSPSTFEDHAEVQSRIGHDAAEQFLISDTLLRDHLRSAEQTAIDPIFTVEIMDRIVASAPAPSRLIKFFALTPVIGVVVFIFTVGFLSGYIAGGLPTMNDVASWMSVETMSSPYVIWSIVALSLLGVGIYQMETT